MHALMLRPQAGHVTGDRLWRMPLYRQYTKQIQDRVADISNVGARGRYATKIICIVNNTIDRKILPLKLFRRQSFPTKIKHAKYLCNVHQPIPILVAKVWRRNLAYAKNLQAKYFIGENIPIYSIVLKIFVY